MTSPCVKILDPNGDLLIIVTASTDAFAAWDGPQHDTTSASEDETDRDSGDEEDRANEAMKKKGVASNTDDNNRNTPSNTLRMKASSSHLALASQRFGRMLKNAWPDLAVIHEEDGLRHWETEAVDLAAFEIVMDVIHGHNRRVPRAVDLEMLAKVAVIVDDLQCREAVEIFVDMWLSKLEESAPPRGLSYSRDLVLWIFIASVFSHDEIFRSCTYTAVMETTGPISSLELPIRGKIIDTLESLRLEHLDAIMDILADAEDRLKGIGGFYCCFGCDCALLGALIIQMRSKGLLDPRPSRPYNDLSISNMIQSIQNFEVPQYYQGSIRRGYNKHLDQTCYIGIDRGFEPLLFKQIRLLRDTIQLIHLKDDLGFTWGCT
ncbi:hypothetical protein F4809DRAFT_606854 [Biscogniauxia mediterranea]|nr:hypothetical protein F4809DRAFT_606854 [Biscogniauxia mediterranea]